MPPNIGDHGWLEFHEDDREAGQFIGAVFNDKFKPLRTEAGEWQYRNKFGASLDWKKDGSTTYTDKAGNTIILDGSGTVTVANKNGNKVILDPGGNVQVIPKGFVFLGGTGSDGIYDFVLTNSGPSINVKAKTA
jgi:hypothetical protein